MSATIGVFDSGFGGLTVLRELLARMPGRDYLYLGDTARLPYGSKSRETIVRYALSSAKFLHEQGAELLVVACNTATALSLPELQEALPIPVIGVIDPGTRALAVACSGETPYVLVLATQATVDSHAYLRSCAAAGLQASEKACPLLVPLVEEGWVPEGVPDPRSNITREILRVYLQEALTETPRAQAMLLGCTHYPLLCAAISEELVSLGHPMPVIDSAQAVAGRVAEMLGDAVGGNSLNRGRCEFFATDSVAKFARLGPKFLGQQMGDVTLVDLGG